MKRYLVFFILILCISSLLICQIVEEDLSVNEEIIKRKFNEAVSRFNSTEQQSSIYDFNEIIVLLEAAVKEKTTTPQQLLYLMRSYDYRAQVYFNIGDLTKAEGDILAILNLDMDYLPLSEASIKYNNLFSLLKEKMTGYFSVTTVPPGAKIYLDDKQIGYSNTPVLKYKIGSYTLRSVLDGYEKAEQVIEINSGKTSKVFLELKRISAALLIWSSPIGVDVYLNDKHYGTTSGMAVGKDAEKLKALGVEAAAFSLCFKISNLQPGKYKLELKKACYQPYVMNLDLPEPADYELDPAVMTPSQGEIVIENITADAEIFLNGQSQGKGNKILKNICGGAYTLVVRFKQGKYLKQFTLGKDETIHIPPSKKPTLLFGGALLENGMVSFDDPLTVKAADILDSLENLNIYIPTVKDRSEDNNLSECLKRINEAINPEHIEETAILDPVVSNLMTGILKKYEAELLFLLKDLGENRFAALLYHWSHGNPDVFIFDTGNASMPEFRNLEGVIKKLDEIPDLQSSWLGIFPIEGSVKEGLLIIETRAGSSAYSAGIQTGDRLIFLNGMRMQDCSRYIEVLGQIKPGDIVTAKIKREGKMLDFNFKAGVTVLTPKPSRGVYYFNRLLAELEAGTGADKLHEAEFVIPYLKGILLYYLGAFEQAKLVLQELKNKKSESVDDGLVSFYLSLIFMKTGDTYGSQIERENYLKKGDARLFFKSGMPVSLIDKYGLYP